MLANILRTDMHAHRRLPADTELARGVAVLARAHQDATWRRTDASNELRSHLREYFPTFLGTGSDVATAVGRHRPIRTAACPTGISPDSITEIPHPLAVRRT